jgi:hypothetical protein
MGLKIFIALMICSFWARAQPSPNSVSYMIANQSVVIGQQTVVIPSTRNIGQNSHQLFLYTGDITTGSCATAGYFLGTLYLQGSTDNSVFINIGTALGPSATSADTNTSPVVLFASGVYPYLRVVYENSVYTGCTVTIWYTGSTSPNAFTGTPATNNDGFFFAPISINTSGDNVVFDCLGAGFGQIDTLYALYLYNPTTANTINVGYGTSTSFVSLLKLTSFQEYAQFNAWSTNTGKPYWIGYGLSAALSNFNIKLTNSTEVDGWAIYRCE